jgi:hypothetical protein
MFRILLAAAFVSIVSSWILAKALSALRSEVAWDIEIDPANRPDEPVFGALGLVFAMVLLCVLLMPSAVTSNGQSISLHDVSHSMRASKDVGTLGYFCRRIESPRPVGILGLLRWLTCDSDFVIPSIARLVGRGSDCLVVRFMAEDARLICHAERRLPLLRLHGRQALPVLTAPGESARWPAAVLTCKRADKSQTLCTNPACLAKAKEEED